MRSEERSQRFSHRNRRFLLVALAAISAGGCATSPDRWQPVNVPRTVASQTSLASGRALLQASLAASSSSTGTSKVRTVGYDDGQFMSSSLPFISPTEDGTQREESDSESRNGKDGKEIRGPSAAASGELHSREELVEPLGLRGNSIAGNTQSVDEFVLVALSGHPKIQAARQRVAAATNVIPQARALPDPMLNNTFWPIRNQALQTAGGRVGNQMSLTQGIPWPEKLGTKAAIASREVQIAQAEVDRIEREITEAVRLAYYEVWFATRAIAIIEETRELVDDLTRVAEARYKSGGTQQDVLRAQLETDRLDDQLLVLTKQRAVAQADLATLMQQPDSLIPEASEELGLNDVPQQLDELLALAEQCSPELRTIAWEIQRDREKQKLACLQKYPDLQLGLNYAIISDNNNVLSPVANGHDNISFTVGTTLPIWRDKINAGIQEAAHRTSSSTHRLEAERDAIHGKLRRLLVQADALVEQQDIYGDRIIPRTEDTLKLAIADYRGKRTDFFTLIETYRELLMFETQLARIEATLAGTVAQIERTVGCPY